MVNGQHFSGTGYQLDGTENRDPILGIIVINPTLESIGETKITSQNYDAEFGQATAGVVSVQTKSGGNTFHGSGFEFFQSDSVPGAQPVHAGAARSADRQVPAGDQEEPVRRLGRRADRAEQVVLLRRLPGHAPGQGRLASAVGADGAGADGRLQRLRLNIFDPQSPGPAVRRTRPFRKGSCRRRRSSILKLIPTAERARQRERHARQLRGVGHRDVHPELDQRPHRRPAERQRSTPSAATSSASSSATARRRSAGRRPRARSSLGGVSDVKNQSLAYGVDYTISSTLLADFRFGWFRYNVNVLPFDFGTTPAADAGIPGLNIDTTFTPGCRYFESRGNQADMACGWSLDDNANRCNCPLDQDEKQWQWSATSPSCGAATP